MPAERFFYEQPLLLGEHCKIQDEEFHHLCHVMRNKVGDTIEIINGKGLLAQGVIERIDKKEALVKIIDVFQEIKKEEEIILVQAIPRFNRLDYIVEKGTELGMTQLWLFPGIKSERKLLNDEQLNRLRTVVKSATKQCGRLFIPEITYQPALKDWKDVTGNAFFGDLSPTAPYLKSFEKQIQASKKIILFVGPEGGFDSSELEFFQFWKTQGVKLHPHILRTDTASISFLSLIGHLKITI